MGKEHIIRAARKIAEQLIPTEVVLDQALASVAKLMNDSVDARISAQLPANCGHRAIKRMSHVINYMTQAREELIEAHAELAQTQKEVGLGEVSYGDVRGCPKFARENEGSVVSMVGR